MRYGEMRSEKRSLIVDVDNTLYDWVKIWHASFSIMFEEILQKTQLDRDFVLSEIRKVFQFHGSTEYTYFLEEVPCLKEAAGTLPVTTFFAHAISAFREARSCSLKLYPTVAHALRELKSKDVLVVAYTESMGFYTSYRLEQLDLDGIVDLLVCPPDHVIPMQGRTGYLETFQSVRGNLQRTQIVNEFGQHKKPNPAILEDILRYIGASIDSTLFVGDSLNKDIAAAKAIKLDHAWAKYGVAHMHSEYDLVKTVSHWTDREILEESRNQVQVEMADCVLENEFAEIFDHYSFGR